MHPVVIMSYDKSPAINKAVAALEEAGMEVRVLNTNSAKLADFLGALAGEDDEEDVPADAAAEEPVVDDEAPAELPPEEPEVATEALEALVNGENVIVEIVDGSTVTLHSSSISSGAKTFYRLNESEFSFWPNGGTKSTQEEADAPVQGGVEIAFKGKEYFTQVIFSEETMNPPVLRIGREWLTPLAG